MSEALKRPYEISVWQDALMTAQIPGETEEDTKEINYYEEKKVIIIGSDKMTSPNRVFNPVLTENVNGEKTLSFSLRYRYYDPGLEQEVTNPFAPYLINERKIKLHYNDQWYDFIIKECNESSDEYVFDYTARDQYALELGKVGYNITLNTELNNNQGTITELAEKVLESTDWKVDKKNSDLLRQSVKEPVYKAQVAGPITVLNVNTNEEVELQNDENAENITIYIFYSYIANNQIENVQFILESDREDYVFDDNNVVTSTNYRFLDEVEFVFPEEEIEEEIEDGGGVDDVGDESADSAEDEADPRAENVQQINIIEIFNEFQAYRLVYDKLIVYDPVMQRTVTIYEAQLKNKTQQIYHYNDYEYTTSEILTNFVTNGSDFNALKDGSLQGWSAAVPSSHGENEPNVLQHLALVTYPDILTANVLSRLSNFSKVRGFMELKFSEKSDLSNGYNIYFNSGIEDNASIIDHIAAGEKFVFRIRFGYSDKKINEENFELQPYQGNSECIRAIISKYELIKEEFKDGDTIKTLYGYKLLPGGTLLNFEGPFVKLNNYITNGILTEDKTAYLVEDVAQTPASNYVYIEDGDEEQIEYVWDADRELFVEKSTKVDFLDYYMTTATAKYSVSNSLLSDPTTKIGIFLYSDPDSKYIADGNHYVYIEDVQLTKYKEDGNGEPLTIGNIPTAVSLEQDYYYLKPTSKMTKDNVNVYGSLEYLAMETGINVDTVKPIYNENCEKILTIEEAQSNCFNILQSLCETFECWMKMEVRHNEDGTIWLDKNFNPYKRIVFKEYAGKENFSGFRYGINLNSISRSIDSNEFVTKLIVDTASNEYTDSGTLSIQNATTNPSNESYILNFSYYLNKGLITNRDECNADVNKFYEDLKNVNSEIFDLEQQRINLESALLKLNSKQTVYDSLIAEAKKEYNETLEKFKQTTKIDYFDYVARQEKAATDPDEEIEALQTNENVLKLIGELYTYSTTVDVNSGLLANLDTEYKLLKLELEGAREYAVNVTTTHPENDTYITQVTVDEYLENFNFTLCNDADEVTYETGLNDRIFTVTNPTALTRLVVNKIPNNYRIEFYVNNKAYWTDDIKNLYISIYDTTEATSLTRRITLVPNPDYKAKFTGIYEKLDEVRARKTQIEKEFYKKYSRFIQEGTWNSTDYIDEDLYYYDALQVSRVSAQPKVSYSISVTEVSELEGLENYYFNVGDKTFVEDGDFFGHIITHHEGRIFKTPIKEEVIVSEVTWNLDIPEENTITVQNYKTQFEDLFQRISATVQTLQYNEATYPKISSVVGANGLIDTELLLQSWNEGGAAGYNLTTTGAIKTTDDGILIQDLTNGANYVKIESRGIKTSTDGGQTWLNVIDGYGINADAINAGIINTQQIWLMDGDNPSFRWDKSGISAYGFGTQIDEPYDLKTYVRFDKYGLYGIQNGADWVATGLDDIKDTARFGLTWDGFFIKNSYTEGYVSISSDDDFQVVTTNAKRDIEVSYHDIEVVQLPLGVFESIEYDDSGESGEEQEPIITRTYVLSLPYEDAEVIKIVPLIGDGAIVGENVVDDPNSTIGSRQQMDPSSYIVDGGTVILSSWSGINDAIFEVSLLRPLNKLDIGGDGILEIKSLSVNGVPTDYQSFDKKTGVITFYQALQPGDTVHVEYVLEHIKIGALDFVNGLPSKYGIKVKNNNGETVFETNDEGNLTVTGTIYANDGVFRGTVYATNGEFNGHIRAYSGEFPGSITVGNGTERYIVIDGGGEQPYIASSDYIHDTNSGWFINGEGDAIFNNVSVRGAIKTSVFEYSEIQAVGGAFLFRPSVVVKSGVLRGEDLVLTLEQSNFFKPGDWCKIGNFAAPESPQGLENAGLAAVYKVIECSPDGKTVVLEGAGELFK